ncbi:hypothetical protein ACW69H_32800 [Streptomyces sp. SS10]
MELDLHSYGDLDWLIAELRMPPEATRASARRLVELACLDAVGLVEIESITPPRGGHQPSVRDGDILSIHVPGVQRLRHDPLIVRRAR